jgi:hypothetical protein
MNLSDDAQRPIGFNCPKCNFFIEMSLRSMLYEPAQTCAGCMTEFRMDRDESSAALQLIQKLHVAMQNLDSVKDFRG